MEVRGIEFRSGIPPLFAKVIQPAAPIRRLLELACGVMTGLLVQDIQAGLGPVRNGVEFHIRVYRSIHDSTITPRQLTWQVFYCSYFIATIMRGIAVGTGTGAGLGPGAEHEAAPSSGDEAGAGHNRLQAVGGPPVLFIPRSVKKANLSIR
jgi:hypothetical protein